MTDRRELDAHLEVVDLEEQAGERLPRRPLVVGPQRHPAARIGRSPWAWVAVVVLLVGWVGLGAYTALTVRQDATRSQELLLAGQTAIRDGRLSDATTAFGEAAEVLRTVPGRAEGLALWPAQLVPTYRRTLVTVAGLGRAGAMVAGAAQDVSAALTSDDGPGLVPEDSGLPIAGLQRLSGVLEDASGQLQQAEAVVEGTPTFGVLDQVAEAHAEFLSLIGPAAEGLQLAADVSATLPGMFGVDGPRRYLLLSSNPTEARGTGGFIGAVSTVTAEDGALTFGEVLETQDLPIPPEGSVAWGDPSLEERWDRYGGSSRLRSINMTPDFPAAALTIEDYWEVVYGEQLDGVISIDPFALQALLSISGPLEVPGFGQVTAEEVVEFVSYDAYALVEDPAERKGLVAGLTTQAFQGFLDGAGDVDPGSILRALNEIVVRDSLIVHAARPEEQEVLVRSGIAGELTADGGDLLAVVLNSGSGSKIDYFLDRTLRYDVQLRPDGAAVSTVTVGLRNDAPTTGELTYMIGPPDPDVPFGAGDNISMVSVYCGPGCTFIEAPDSGYADLDTERTEELGFPVASTWVLTPSMRAQQLIYSYRTPAVWEQLPGGDRVYRLRYEHQTVIRPTTLDLRIDVPDGFRAVTLPDGAEVVEDQVVLRSEVLTDLSLEVRFAPR